jgi:hypothetical protein
VANYVEGQFGSLSFGSNSALVSLNANLGSKIRFASAQTHPAKLFRIRNGEMTYLNGWANIENYTDRVEQYARQGDQDGDAYLLLDVVTGKVVRSFKLEAPVVAKEVVDF